MKDKNKICKKYEGSSKDSYKQFQNGFALLLSLFIILGLFNWGKKNAVKNNRLEAELANANSKIELLEESERYELNDVFVVTTISEGIFEKNVVNDLVTCKKYEMPRFLVANKGKTIFEKDAYNDWHNLISDFDYWGETTIFFSVKNGEVCGYMEEIYTNYNENPNVDVVAKCTQINFNGESEIIKTLTKAKALTNYDFYDQGTSEFFITSLKDRLEYKNSSHAKEELERSYNKIYTKYKNYKKEYLTHSFYDSSNLFFTKLKDRLEYNKEELDSKIYTSYTKEELIEIEDMLNEKNKKRILG